MKKRAVLYILGSPFIYLYGLAENHFSFGKSIRGYSLDFCYEYFNGWRILFGKEYKDKSIEVGLYEYKLKAKKAKFDLDIALLMEELYRKWDIGFDKKKRSLRYNYSCGYGDVYLSIKQIGRDEFTVKYYDDSGWNRKKSLSTDYIFSKEEVIATIRTIKERG